MNALIKYEAARQALMACVTLDEVKDIADKAVALQYYAKISNKPELEHYASAITLTAKHRIGVLSAAIPDGRGANQHIPTSGKELKHQSLKAAGLSTSEAYRCEQFASAITSDGLDTLIEHAPKKTPVPTSKVIKNVVGKARRDTRETPPPLPPTTTVTECQEVIQCDVLITDPPYGILNEPWEPADISEFTREWLSRWKDCGADLMAVFWSQEHLFLAPTLFNVGDYQLTQVLVWHYPNNKGPQSRAKFKQTWEPILFMRRRDTERKIGATAGDWGKDLTDFDCHVAAVPQTNFNNVNEKRHPAQKPISVMRWLVNAMSEPGDLVCDPFCGSGTTGIASIQLGRSFHGIENDADFLSLARERIAIYGVE